MVGGWVSVISAIIIVKNVAVLTFYRHYWTMAGNNRYSLIYFLQTLNCNIETINTQEKKNRKSDDKFRFLVVCNLLAEKNNYSCFLIRFWSKNSPKDLELKVRRLEYL